MNRLRAAHIASPAPHVRDGVIATVLADRLGPRMHNALAERPPANLRDKVLGQVGPDNVTELRDRSRRREMALAVIGVAAAVLALFVFVQLRDGSTDGSSFPAAIPTGHDVQEIALEGKFAADATLTHYRHDNYRLVLSVEGYPVTPPRTQYAVWLRGDSGVVPIGGFRLKGADDFRVPFAIAVDPARFPEIVVTLEPVDGDPDLTGEVVNSAVLDAGSVHHGTYEE